MDEEEVLSQVQQPEGKVGAKKMRKLQEKAERKAAREVGHFSIHRVFYDGTTLEGRLR